MLGCGSGLNDLFRLADQLLEDNRARVHTALTGGSASRPARRDLRQQLYDMYGRGELSEAAFAALKSVAERGALQPADLAVHRARARRRRPRPEGSETAAALRKVQTRLMQLEEAGEGSSQTLAELEARMAGLMRRATDKEQTAREVVVTDEDAARRLLREKAELEASRERLAEQARALRDDMSRLGDLRTQLEAKAAELEAVRAREELAAVVDEEVSSA
jgi:chromosome segregation ATPase